MSGITPSLLQRLQKTLLRCAPFSSDQALQAIFVDSRLSQWKADLPEATSDAERVHLTVEYLSDKHNAVGENGLVLFLYVLRDHASPGDNCHHDLGQLAAELEQRAPTPDPAEWDIALERYRERVKRLHGTMRVLGKYEPVSLEGIYTDVYLLNQPAASRYVDPSTLPERIKGERQDGLELVKHLDTQALVILGKPGAGKTTFLKHIALQAAEGQLGDRVPIFIALREWADDDDLLDVLTEPFAGCGLANPRAFVEHLLETERSLLLLDALDEVGESARHNLIKALERFSRRYLDCHILLTCRTAATPYQFERAKTVEVADFTIDQMQAFAKNWFGEDTAKAEKFQRKIEQDERLRDLGRTPLLLGMLCLTFDKRGDFPQKRADLYRDALDTLLVQWDDSRNIERDAMRGAEVYHSLSLGRKHQLFAYIAYNTFEQGETLIPQEQLERLIIDFLNTVPNVPPQIEIDTRAIIKDIESQHGILVEFNSQVYAFSHPTFQEYFTACYVAGIHNEKIFLNLFTHAHKDRWREVILLTASMLSDAETFFDFFLQALDDLINHDEKLIALLVWITRNAAKTTYSHNDNIRSYYIWLVLEFEFACASAHARRTARNIASRITNLYKYLPHNGSLILDRDRALALANRNILDSTSITMLAFDLSSATIRHHRPGIVRALHNEARITRVLGREVTLCTKIFYVRIRAISLAHAFDFKVSALHNLDLEIAQASSSTRTENQKYTLKTFSKALSFLGPPKKGIPLESQRTFLSQLRAIMIKHHEITHSWNFTQEQLEALKSYLSTVELFVECLEVAKVADRAAIKDRLLLPPGYDPEGT